MNRVTLANLPWSSVDESMAARIPCDSPEQHRDWLRRLVDSGQARVSQIMQDGKQTGLLCWAIDEGAAREFVVVASFCESADGQPVTRELVEAAEALARRENCISLRLATVRRAVASVACSAFGFRVSEIVLRKSLLNGKE